MAESHPTWTAPEVRLWNMDFVLMLTTGNTGTPCNP
jgi:hypothetical protein